MDSCPTVEVEMVMLEPLTQREGVYLVPVESANRTCPCWVGAVEVPVPPLAGANTPEISEEPEVKLIAPLNRAPAEVDRTGRAWLREEMVEEPVTDRVPVMEVVARVLTPETVKAVEEALPKEEVAVAVMEVKEGLGLKVMVVEVPIKTCCPPVIERLVLVTLKFPKVVVPRPPLLRPKIPETSLDNKLMAPLNNAPATVDLTGKAWLREEMVVEPFAATLKNTAPVEDATCKISKVGELELPCTTKVELGEVLLIPRRWLVASHKKAASCERLLEWTNKMLPSVPLATPEPMAREAAPGVTQERLPLPSLERVCPKLPCKVGSVRV